MKEYILGLCTGVLVGVVLFGSILYFTDSLCLYHYEEPEYPLADVMQAKHRM